jgi:sodium transport system permease protein
VGAVYPAIDLGAGEKERGTLETLLLTPIPRTYLVLGKFLTILTTALLSAMLTVVSMGF